MRLNFTPYAALQAQLNAAPACVKTSVTDAKGKTKVVTSWPRNDLTVSLSSSWPH